MTTKRKYRPRPSVTIGEVFGLRTVIEEVPDIIVCGFSYQAVRVRCQCDREDIIKYSALLGGHGLSCRSCGSRGWKRFQKAA